MPLWKSQLLAAFRLCPNVMLACEAAGITRATFTRCCQDAAFNQEVIDAMAAGIDLAHACAWQRATEGTVRAIYQGGIRVGHEVVYSDKLLLELLRAHKPESFGRQGNLSLAVHIRNKGGTINVATPEEILERVRQVTPLIRNRSQEAPAQLQSRTSGD